MLSYAFRVLKDDYYDSLGSEPFENIEDLMTSIIVRGMNRQIKRGIFKSYTLNQEEAPQLKGKLEIRSSMMLKFRNKKMLAMEFDELSSNNLLNQIIKSTLIFLLKQKNLKKDIAKEAQKTLFQLESIDTVDLKQIKQSTFQINKHHQEYHMLVSICFMVIDSLILSDDTDALDAKGFRDDQTLPKLFEKFVLEYYKYHYPEVHASAAHISWDLNEGSVHLLPTMKTDITLKYNNKTLIIDTKFYQKGVSISHHDDEKYKLHSNNLYQIFSYVQNADIERNGSVSGVLLYAKTNELTAPNADFKIKGNFIATRNIDLNTKFDFIQIQLNKIIDEQLMI
jgi:5-methylcytosine-specific restriction enzyme subunit McrC